MRVLIGCECSGTVRDAFLARGHDAVSCDIEPSDTPGPHITGDLRDVLSDGWDILVAHPPCIHTAVSGFHWTVRGLRSMQPTIDSLDFFCLLLSAPIPRIAIEQPVSIISTRVRPPDQVIQPWQFGHPESKATCLWLKNLPRLTPTNTLPLPSCGYWENQTPSGQNRLGPSEDRSKIRAVTYQGIAAAMAIQWGSKSMVHGELFPAHHSHH